ncbi:MAG: hypothetical protein JW821_16485, partial [Deltaproteobacteria bacterium]|nr:hypothetical protein [Deltaproteobacteria bacterium]
MGAITQLVFTLSPILPYALVGLVFLILFVLGLLLYLFRTSKKLVPKKEAAEEAPEPAESGREAPPAKKAAVSGLGLRRSFSKAVRVLRANVSGRNYRYQIPWYLMVGEAASGKTATLNRSGLNLPLGKPIGEGPEIRKGCNWWFFEKGIVLDIAGDLILRADGRTSDDRGWRLLLRLLQKHRPQRPIDGIILSVPCEDLLGAGEKGEADFNRIAEKADHLYKKLWQTQKALGIRLPVYVLVTKCDQIEGFQSFCREIPSRLSHNIFGWSNPYAVDTGYTGDWVREAFEGMHAELSHVQFEIFSEGTEILERDGLFLFPTNLQSISESVHVYLDHLFRESVYHESFIFRGLYFCGDSGTEEERGRAKKPFFLRDLFDKKIFPEFSLARPATRSVLSKNRSVLAAQIVAGLLVLIGGLGLWRAAARLQVDKSALLPVLEQVAEDVNQLRDRDETREEGLEL